MCFENFIGSLKRDISAQRNVNIEQTKDAQGRPHTRILNHNKVIAEIGYECCATRNRAARIVRLIASDGSCEVLRSSGIVMGTALVSHLSKYVNLKDTKLFMQG